MRMAKESPCAAALSPYRLSKMVRTIKLAYKTVPQAIGIIAQWRQAQSVVIRTSYNRVCDGLKDKDLLIQLRSMPQGKLDSWLTLSAIKRARALYQANPARKVIFGGKHGFKLRAEGKITKSEWRAKRLLPLYFEGHAKSYGEQGGNHRFVLDIEHNTVWFYPRAKTALALTIKLGKKTNYRNLLEALQFRCTWQRDTPFTVSLTESEISISWNQTVGMVKRVSNSNRVLALDLNPHRIGVAVLERTKGGCKPLHWGVYDYPGLNRRLGQASQAQQPFTNRTSEYSSRPLHWQVLRGVSRQPN